MTCVRSGEGAELRVRYAKGTYLRQREAKASNRTYADASEESGRREI